jgi:two-component system OmpR family sensor kinase
MVPAINWRKIRVHSLRWKLGGASLLIVVISVGLMAYFTNLSTTREFTRYLSQVNQQYVENTSSAIGQIYAEDGNWSSIQLLLPNLLRSNADRLVVADAYNVIVGDTAAQWLGKAVGNVGLSNGMPILVSGRKIGELYLVTNQMGSGHGYMGGMGWHSMNSLTTTSAEQDFLNQFNRSLLLTGLIGGVVALIVGLWLTGQITRSVKALADGAHQIASGNLNHRVKIKTKDELATLGQSFNTMATSLEEGEYERKRMIADIAHELRTPLTVIEGTITGIQDGVFKPDQEHLDAIKEQTSLLTRLTSDLQDLSLAESGQMKLDLALVDLVDLVRRKTSQFEVNAYEKGIHIKLDVPEDAVMANVDSKRIGQVLGNLVTNAIRYTPSGGQITIVLHEDDKNGDSDIILSVADNGEGIAPEHLPHIFERFYRADKSRARSEGGSGLGLAIVKQMVQSHGGRVWVESEAGKGSTFYVMLPGIRNTKAK